MVEMVCRLCLVDLNDENAVALFETSELDSENQLLKMIAKYINLELSRDDPVSTSVCQNCTEHLEDFHQFWIHVDEKQSTLRNEFLEDKGEDNTLSEGDEESVLDLNNISMEFVEVAAVEEFGCANEIDENNVEEVYSSATISAFDDSSAASDSDDNTLTLSLRSKTKKASKSEVSKKPATRSKKVSKAKIEDGTDVEVSESESNARNSLQKQYEKTIANFMKLSCDLCKRTVGNFGELRKHFLKSHGCSAYVKCCRRSYNKPSTLVEHIRSHQNPDVYKCDICDKQFRSEVGLLKHKESHLTSKDVVKSTIGKNRTCKIRNESFPTDRRLRLHKNSAHKGIPENDKDHICDICNKRFLTRKSMRHHISTVHSDIWYSCEPCGKSFKHKRTFERHSLEHQGIVGPPAQCDICDAWLKNKNSLNHHRLKHEKAESDCTICGRSCVNRFALQKHVNYMHRLKNNFQCDYCEKSFKLERNLEEHVAKHTGTLLYTCPHCSKECRSKSNMYVHIKRVHTEEWLQTKAARSNDPKLKSTLE